MTTATHPAFLSLSSPKRVLLVDVNQARLGERAAVLRGRGVEVTCAGSFADARLLWRPDFYNLVVIEPGQDSSGATEMGDDIERASPAQPVRFLVGKPDYLAKSPAAEVLRDTPLLPDQKLNLLLDQGCDRLPYRGGFLEVAWRVEVMRRARNRRAA